VLIWYSALYCCVKVSMGSVSGDKDGTWSVDLPSEEVPPELPEPCLGINFARDGMQKR